MENILIIRSANANVIKKLVHYIKNEYKEETTKIYMLIQNGSVESFKKDYPNIQYIVKEDGPFLYKKFKKNKKIKQLIKSIEFSDIYIPSSYIGFDDFYETFLIAGSIRAKNYFLFNNEYKIRSISLSKFKIIVEKHLNRFTYSIKIILAIILAALVYVGYYIYYAFLGKYKRE